MINFLKNTALFAVTMLILLVVTELVLRQTNVASFSLNRGFLFASQPSFIATENDAVKYMPNSDFREVAVFGEHVEYDITSKTNDFGFFDNVSYLNVDRSKRGVAFLGDSFTAGSGGSKAWVSSLRESVQRPDLNLFSLGVSGTGILHFEKLLEHAVPVLPIQDVYIMMITDDFFRPLWYPHAADAGMYFCHPEAEAKRCMRADPKLFRIRSDESQAKILERTQEQYDYRNIDKDSNRAFHQRLRLFNLFCHAAFSVTQSLESLQSISKTCPQLRLYHTLRYQRNELYQVSVEALSRFKSRFPNLRMRVFHMPQKSEVYGGNYSLDIQAEVEKAGLDYVSLLDECEWSLPLFHINDGHPNDTGYLKLSECMQKFLPEPTN